MNVQDVSQAIWKYSRPTLTRWVVGGIVWAGVHWGVKLLTDDQIATWVNINIDTAAPYIIAGVSAGLSWVEKKALHEASPPAPPTP